MYKRNRFRCRRRAYSLVELIINISSGALVFLLAIGALERTMQISGESKERSEHQSALARLGTQFRSDVHEANQSTVLTDNASTQLTLSDARSRTITYAFHGSTVTRVLKEAGRSQDSRESYNLSKISRVRFGSSQAERVELEVVRDTPEGEMLEARVEARLGRLAPLQLIRKEE